MARLRIACLEDQETIELPEMKLSVMKRLRWCNLVVCCEQGNKQTIKIMNIKTRNWPLLLGLMLCLHIGASTAQIADKGVQLDILMGKILPLIKAGKNADAVPYFVQVEALNTPLPENFHFYYIDALDKSGNSQEALTRAENYLNKYGKNGKYYSSVLPIVTRLSMNADTEASYRANIDNAKAIALKELKPLERDFARGHVRGGSDENAVLSDIAPLVTRFKRTLNAYMNDAIKPSVERLKRLLKEREIATPGATRDKLDLAIRKTNEDIGFIAALPRDFLFDLYLNLEKFRLTDDARAIEDVRLHSFMYSRADGQNDKYRLDDIPQRITVQKGKFDVVMRSW